MSLALLLALAAWAEPEEVLPEGLRGYYADARRHEARGQLAAAAIRYRIVVRGAPEFHRAALDLGRVHEALGEIAEAEAIYRSLPFDADAVEALGRLQLADQRPDEAAATFRKLRELRPEWPGTRVLEADALAAADPLAAAALLHDYLGYVEIDLAADGAVDVTSRVAQRLREEGLREEAVRLVRALLEREPTAGEGTALGALALEIEIDEDAEALAAAADAPLAPEQVARLRRAREAFAAGDADLARRELEVLVIDAPRSAITWATLADVREATGDPTGAEIAIRKAERLDPLEAAYPARLGDLLSTWYGGRFDEDAADAYARAARRDAADPDLWYRKAVAERRAGRVPQSIASFERVLALDPDGPHAREARIAVAARDLPMVADVETDEAPGPPPELPEEAWWAYHRAWAWRERDAPEAMARALREIATARRLAPDFVPAIDLEAAIRAELGQTKAAIGLYEESLRKEPEGAELAGRLARLYARAGRTAEAEALRDRAAALGDPDALWWKARAEADAGHWLAARRTLAEFFARTTAGPAYEQALRLDAALERRIRLAGGLFGGGALALVALPIGIRWRRRSGASLATLLAKAPGAWRDVARICSAIRHEVLKHHASVLPAVVDALEVDHDPEPARWAADRLFGERGALARLDGYVRELDALGRAAGVRLNLRARDPVLGPLLVAADRLRGLERAMRRGHGRRLAEDLDRISQALNRDAYRALGRLVDNLCVLPITHALLAEIWQDVAAEFRGRPLPRPVIEVPAGEVLRIRVFRADLADVVGNLVRNAIEASIEAGADEVGVGLGLDEDDITGLERVEIRVRDRAPRRLTTATLRGRYVARGLGLAVDLTSRAGGSIHVEEEPGWAKAVVVRLPRAELPEEDAA